MKNVVLIGPAHPLRGGLSTFNERMARQWKAEGCNIIIYTFSLQYPGFLFPGKSQFSDDPKPDDLDIRVKINSVNPFNWWKIGREIRKMKPDLVILRYWIPFMGPCLGSIARLVRKNKFTKVVAITDNVIPHEKRIGDKMFTRYFLKSVDGFVTMSKAVLEELKQFVPAKPKKFTPHPLYDNFGEKLNRENALERIGLDPEFRYILFFGFIRKYKGLDLLLDAFADERFRTMKIRLIIAGEYYTDSQPYQEQINRLGLGEFIIEKNDFIPNDEVANYFCASDLVVQPYWDATQSGVTQIAYHFEIPMIVTNVAGLPENVPDGKVGFVVGRNPSDVAEGIIRYFRESRMAEFSKNMETEKLKYSWSELTGAIREVAE